jgi:hypothetical protein
LATATTAYWLNQDIGNFQERKDFQVRGVVTAATIQHSVYDPHGGDPDGWTTDEVTTDTSGQTIHTTVRHHGDNALDRTRGHVNIIFDRQMPSRALSIQAYQLNDAEPNAAIAAILLTVALCATGSSAWATSAAVRRRGPGSLRGTAVNSQPITRAISVPLTAVNPGQPR